MIPPYGQTVSGPLNSNERQSSNSNVAVGEMRSPRKAEDSLANQRPNLNAALSALGLYHVLQILMEYDRQVWEGRQRARRGGLWA